MPKILLWVSPHQIHLSLTLPISLRNTAIHLLWVTFLKSHLKVLYSCYTLQTPHPILQQMLSTIHSTVHDNFITFTIKYTDTYTHMHTHTHTHTSPMYYHFYVNLHCWPKTNRLPAITPAKMSWLVKNRELQIGFCKHICQQGKENTFMEAKTKLEGYSKQTVMDFHCLSPCQKKRGAFLLGSDIITGHESSSFLFHDSV